LSRLYNPDCSDEESDCVKSDARPDRVPDPMISVDAVAAAVIAGFIPLSLLVMIYNVEP
jgi:hypothetical protein